VRLWSSIRVPYIKRQHAEHRICSRRQPKSIANNCSQVLVLVQVVLRAGSPGGVVTPVASSMTLLQRAADLDKHEHCWRCCPLPLHFDPSAGHGEVPPNTTISFVMCCGMKKVVNALLTFFGLAAETITGCDPVRRANKLRLMRDCRGMRTSHKRRADEGLGRWEGRDGSEYYQY
jgi:hypothetical protein